jgi:hypothetical protein
MTADQENTNAALSEEQQWPGVAPAQVFVLPSYQWMLSRFEAADSRLQTLLTFVATVTFAIPTVSRAVNPNLPTRSGWFVAAIAVAAIMAVMGIVARLRGHIILPSPEKLYNQSLTLTEWEFQRDALYFAGQNFAANWKTVNGKARAAAVIGGLFVLELVLFLLWVSYA